MEIPIEEYFRYHPPTTNERIEAHKVVNEAALHFAQVVQGVKCEEEWMKMAFFAIQQARMFANQGITVESIKKIDN